MDQNNLKNTEKLPYETPQIKVLGKLSQLIQGASGGHNDSFPYTSGGLGKGH